MPTIKTESYGSGEYLSPGALNLAIALFKKKKVQLWLARRHACPIPDEVERDYGLEKSIYRYSECNRVSRRIWNIAKHVNPDLYALLTQWKKRSPGEKVGKREDIHVPEIHLTELSPLSTPTGYALARIVICIMNALKKRKNDPNHAWKVVQKFVGESQTPEELLARLSDYALKCEVSPTEVLSHVFAQGAMDEENTRTDFYVLSLAMNAHALKVMEYYDRLQSEDKRREDILQTIPRPSFIRTE